MDGRHGNPALAGFVNLEFQSVSRGQRFSDGRCGSEAWLGPGSITSEAGGSGAEQQNLGADGTQVRQRPSFISTLLDFFWPTREGCDFQGNIPPPRHLPPPPSLPPADLGTFDPGQTFRREPGALPPVLLPTPAACCEALRESRSL